jgi:hypothetical protein
VWQSPTTLGSAASQSKLRDTAETRRWIRWLAAGIVAAATAAVIVIVVSRGNPALPIATPTNDAALAGPMSVLTITADPSDATIRANGIEGVSPLTLRVARGSKVTISGDRQGFQSLSRTVDVDANEQAIRLTLDAVPPAADAAPPAADTPASNPERPTKPPRQPRPPGRNPDTFNPNAVGGD